jgi:predicted enzyme related to lactoylglutathione lyase
MSGQIVHFEIPADDTAKGREFWGSLFGWQFQAAPGAGEYYLTEISPGQTGGAITGMEPGKRGTRAYFDVDDINAWARSRERAPRRGGRAEPRPWNGLVLDLQGPAGQRVRPLAERHVRTDPGRVSPGRPGGVPKRDAVGPTWQAASWNPSLGVRRSSGQRACPPTDGMNRRWARSEASRKPVPGGRK